MSDAKPLPHSFYSRDTVAVARDLVGKVLIHRSDEGEIGGIIVETEAYGPDDPANHAHKGPRPRNAVMFGPPGMAYVYRIYGMYWCVNAVTEAEGVGEAVLIRALQPTVGIETLRRNRGMRDELRDERLLCGGPGRLCQALGITGAHNGTDLVSGPIRIIERPGDLAEMTEITGIAEIVTATRIGITKAAHLPWRFCLAGSPYLSKKP